MQKMNHSVALVAGLATGLPVVLLVFIYVAYCCCKRKQKDELLQEPRLWRRDVHSRSSHDLFIPPYVPRIVQRFVQHSSKNSSETTSTQTSPVDDKTFFSEGSEPYRTAPDDIGGLADRERAESLGGLQVPEVRRSSLLQPSTSSGESSESTYEHTPKQGVGPRSPRSLPKDNKSFEFVRPIPVKPLITITRAESLSKDDINARIDSTSYGTDIDQARQAHSDSQLDSSKKSRDNSSRSLENINVNQQSNERRGSTDRSLAIRPRSTPATRHHEPGKTDPSAKIPVNISSQVIRSRRGSKGKTGQGTIGRINISLQYKQTTCDLFVKIIQARDLPAKDLRRNTSSPCIRIYALPCRRHNHRTNVIQNNLNPTFNELFIISGLTLTEVQQLSLQILIIHNEIISRNVVIGEVMVTLSGLDLTGDEVQIWRELRAYHFQNVLGELHISVCHQPLSSRLSVTVLQARNLPKISNLNIGDPYVKVELFSSRSRVAKKKTRVKKKTVNPKFAQTFTFDLAADSVLDMMTMTFTVMVQDSSGCHERIGQVVLSASSDGPEFGHWSQVIANPHCPIEQWHMIHE